MEPYITVIVPHYNNQSSIKKTISSVLNQSYKKFELIIIDDCSDDVKMLENIISGFNDNRISLIKHTTNKNGSAARNTGIANANGEWIAYLDADDEWEKDHLINYVKLLDDSSENTLFYCKSVVKTNDIDDIIMPLSALNAQSISDYLFCSDGFIPTPSFFISKKASLKIRWNENLKRHQDYDLLLNMEKNGIKFKMSDHTGVIIHWEDNDTESKGGTWKFSYNYVKTHKQLFTNTGYNCFVLKHVVYALFQKRNVIKGLTIFFNECSVSDFNFKDYIFLLNYLIFGNLRLIYKLNKLF